MHSHVRDYIVNSSRIGSLLKDHVGKTKESKNYLIRIRTRFPAEAIRITTSVGTFHDMGMSMTKPPKLKEYCA
jgi:hypothetical protein